MRKQHTTESRRRLHTAMALLLVCVLVLTAIVSGALSATAYAADSTILLSGSEMDALLPGEPTWYTSIEDEHGTLWTADTQVEIFKIAYENDRQEVTVAGKNNSKVIAPGTENSYSFAVKNTATGVLEYKLTAEAWITSANGSVTELPVLARLQGLDWLVGGENTWENVMALNGAEEGGYIHAGKHVLYTLQWQWPFEQDLNGDGNIDDGDALDTWLATQGDVSLSIKLNVVYGYTFPVKPLVSAPVPEILDSDNHMAYYYGYPDGTIRPDAAITRAEAATIFYRVLKAHLREYYNTSECAFTDVAPDEWYASPVATLTTMGIFLGYPDGTFQPDAYITRAEFATVLARVSQSAIFNNNTTNFTDIDDHWAEDEIMLIEDFNWIQGYPDGTFGPANHVTRAEAAAMVNRVLHRLPESIDNLLPDMKVWPDNADPSAWYYIDIQEASHLHLYGRLLGTREKWLEIIG